MRKLCVLIVDDSPVFLNAARDFVASLPEVECVECENSSAEALSKAAEFPADLVLMDIVMPGMNGLETMQVLRSRFPALPMYAVTLCDAAAYRAAALESGAVDLISKTEFATAIPDLIAQLARDRKTGTDHVFPSENVVCPLKA